MPCHPGRARELLKKGKAALFRLYPYTIILLSREGGKEQPVDLKIDPGSKTTGIALIGEFKKGISAIWAAHLQHKGEAIKQSLLSRRAIRRARRSRKTRYRPARFDNRTRPQGWLSPSLRSRVDNIVHLSNKLLSLIPIRAIIVESICFDTQKMQNAEISGAEYQRGTLFGYEMREYLLEKWQRKCAYCQESKVRLEIDHIISKALGGTNQIDNLTLCCRSCNVKKGSKTVETFLKDSQKVENLIKCVKQSLKDTAAVNAARNAVKNALVALEKTVLCGSGAQTKFNRLSQGLPKDHWIDALCIGEMGTNIYIPNHFSVLNIQAKGRGSRQQCRVDRFGFPRTSSKAKKRVLGFQTGDFVKAFVRTGKKIGNYRGRVAIRSTGNFNIKTTDKTVEGINVKYCKIIQRSDGYFYHHLQQKEQHFPRLKSQVSVQSIL